MPQERILRRYIDAVVLLALALVLLPISGVEHRDALAVGLSLAFLLYAAWLTLRLRRASRERGSSALLFAVASLSAALFMLSVAIGPVFGEPGAGNWLLPVTSLVTGAITLLSSVALYMKVSVRRDA